MDKKDKKKDKDAINDWDEIVNNDLCLLQHRGCKEKKYTRGLCKNHYHMLCRRVKLGHITWDIAIQRMLALPSRRRVYDEEFDE